MDLFENLQKLGESEKLIEMANVVGKRVKTDHIEFSFYFSDKFNVNHGIRAKIFWNREKMHDGDNGYLELHGDYQYVPSPDSKMVSEKQINHARQFFKKYKVLFAAGWELELDLAVVQMYFMGKTMFEELLDEFDDLSEEHFELIHEAKDIFELEQIVRKYNIFNMND